MHSNKEALQSTVESLISQIHAQGYGVVHSLFDRQTVLDLREQLHGLNELHNQNLRHPNDRDMVHNCHEKSVDFLQEYEEPTIDGVLTGLLGHSYIIYAFQSSSLPPNGTNNANRIHCDSPRLIPGYITNVGVIITLDDYTDQSGPIEFLPSSHTYKAPPSHQEFKHKAQKVNCRAGSVIIFNARTWHREGINYTGNYRHSLTANFCRCYMRQRFDFVRMAQGSGLILRLTSNQRKLLGYDVRLPASEDEFYLPESRRMYKSGQE